MHVQNHFPENLRPFLQSPELANHADKLDKELNKKTREAFLRFKKDNPTLMKASPTLRSIDKRIKKRHIVNKQEFCKNFETRKLEYLKTLPLKDLSKHADLIQGYMQVGVLTSDDITSLLTPMLSTEPFSPEHFEMASRLFHVLPFEQALTFLSKNDANGQTPLHQAAVFEKLTPWLMTLSHEQVKQVLSIQNAQRMTPLYMAPVFAKAIPYLSTRPDVQLKDLLAIDSPIYNDRSAQPLSNPQVFTQATDWLRTLPVDLQLELLTQETAESVSPLEDAEIFKRALPLLFSLPFDQLWDKILTDANINGLEKLSRPEIYQVAVAFMGPLPADQELILKIALAATNEDRPDLQDIRPRQHAFYASWNREQIETVFSYQITDEQTMGDCLANNKIFRQTLSYMPPEQVMAYLSTPYDEGNTLLHQPQIFAAALPFLEGRRDATLLLFQKNDHGETPFDMFKDYINKKLGQYPYKLDNALDGLLAGEKTGFFKLVEELWNKTTDTPNSS